MEISEQVRYAMRRWPSGVAVVTCRDGFVRHGMTVNSLTSISLEPPYFSVSMNNNTRTCSMVRQSGVLAFTFLSEAQQDLSDRFAGRIGEEGDRLAGVETFEMVTGVPLLTGGLAFLDCRVVFEYPMPLSTLFIAEVLAASSRDTDFPLVYYNRSYPRLVHQEE